MTRVLIIAVLVLLGCNRPRTTEKPIKDNMVTDDTSLNGTWTDGSIDIGLFTIKSDSIYDIKNKETTGFTRIGDSIMFHHLEYVHRAKMYKTHADTLMYEADSIKIKYWKASLK